MEKIYMEENRKRKKSVIDFSVVLSFAVAIFAVVSLVAAGFNNVSYAAPVTDEKITFYNSGIFVDGSDGTSTFSVPLYYADTAHTKPLFCIEHKASVTSDSLGYTRGNEITDYGLLYLLNNSFVNGKKIVNSSNSNDYVEAWATQVAIWMYLYETDPSNTANTISSDELTAIQNATKISSRDLNSGLGGNTGSTVVFPSSIYTTYIKPVVDAAKSASSLKKITITAGDGDLAKTEDGKFYQSTLVSVVGDPSNDLINYDIDFSGIDGVKAVDENGNDMNLSGVAPGQKFYVRIPTDKVTEATQTLRIGVTGHFNTLTGHEYNADVVAGDEAKQKVVTVTGTTKDVSNGLTLEITGAPDTGMNTAQTVYFIGLIVLLCGVGIVYANAKPVEARQ